MLRQLKNSLSGNSQDTDASVLCVYQGFEGVDSYSFKTNCLPKPDDIIMFKGKHYWIEAVWWDISNPEDQELARHFVHIRVDPMPDEEARSFLDADDE